MDLNFVSLPTQPVRVELTLQEQMVSDLEAAEVEVTEAIAASDKTKAEYAALEETMRIQQVRLSIQRGVVRG